LNLHNWDVSLYYFDQVSLNTTRDIQLRCSILVYTDCKTCMNYMIIRPHHFMSNSLRTVWAAFFFNEFSENITWLYLGISSYRENIFLQWKKLFMRLRTSGSLNIIDSIKNDTHWIYYLHLCFHSIFKNMNFWLICFIVKNNGLLVPSYILFRVYIDRRWKSYEMWPC
jgi:hypothetical protein